MLGYFFMEMSRRVGTIRCKVIALALMVWWCQHTIVAFVRHGSLKAKIHQSRPVFMSGSPYYVSQEAIDVPKLAGGMKYRQLHHSDLKISYVGIGTLAFGEQVSRSTAFALLDKATKDYAVNFVDTSEGFPMPLAETTYGHAELIVGDWLKQNPASFRDKVVISTKVVGSCPKIDWMRTDNSKGTRVNAKQVEEAVDNSLRRLKVDHIDVLSFQWPDRYVVINGADQYHDELEVKDATPFREQLELMQRLIQKGKVRHFALSNETPYGVGSWTTLADAHGLPRPLFTSNQYSLMDRYDFETGMKEALSNAKMPLVAYSPLAGGALTGKYSRPFEDIDANARMKRFPGFYARYVTEECRQAIKEYLHIAEENYAALAPLALAWVYQQPFVVSTLIGATTVQQLEQNILANNFTPLNDDVNAAFDRVYRQNPSAGRGPAALNDPRIETFDPRRRPWGLREEDLDPELAQLLDEVYLDGEDE